MASWVACCLAWAAWRGRWAGPAGGTPPAVAAVAVGGAVPAYSAHSSAPPSSAASATSAG